MVKLYHRGRIFERRSFFYAYRHYRGDSFTFSSKMLVRSPWYNQKTIYLINIVLYVIHCLLCKRKEDNMKPVTVRLTSEDLKMIEQLKELMKKEWQEIGLPLEITTSDILRATLRRSYDQIIDVSNKTDR